MSAAGKIIPVVMAVGFGIWNGYYAFNSPLWEQSRKNVEKDIQLPNDHTQQQPSEPKQDSLPEKRKT